MRLPLLAPLFLSFLASVSSFASVTAQTDHVQVEVLQGKTQGKLEWLFSFQIQPGWHLYYSNPGDTGLPPEIVWRAEDKEKAGSGQFLFPVPHAYRLEHLMNYGYEDELLLPWRFGKDPIEGEHVITLKWLVCEKVCIPEKVKLSLTVGESEDAHFSAQRAQAEQKIPKQASPDRLKFEGILKSSSEVILGFRPSADIPHPEKLRFLPAIPKLFAGNPLDIAFKKNPAGEWVGQWPLNPTLTEEKRKRLLSAPIPGILWDPALSAGEGAYAVEVPPLLVEPLSDLELQSASTAIDRSAPLSSAWVLVFSFLGGLLLNLMPCVFPVLFLKVYALLKTSGADRTRERVREALGYSLGVVVTFLFVGGVLVALRAGGAKLGWGFQLQSPSFVAVMVLLLSVLALNFWGWVEWSFAGLMRLGGSVSNGGESSVSKSILTGVLAVIVATPCTAPFMGSALGVALAGPPSLAIAVFGVMGLGLALPFLLIAAFPKLGARLPRPGAWMERLKKAMAIPLALTVAWLLWVLTKQVSQGAWWSVVLAVGALVLFAILVHRKRLSVSGFTRVSVGMMLGLSVLISQENRFFSASERAAATEEGSEWIAFTPEILEQNLSQNLPVFIDFTASWCLTCQVNERVVLSRKEVLKAFRDQGVVLLKADWTEQSAVITEALDRIGRKGVPAYALYSGRIGEPPQVLSEVLTVEGVLDSLKRLEGGAE